MAEAPPTARGTAPSHRQATEDDENTDDHGDTTMTAAQFEDLQVDEAADVLAWRFDTLCRTGFDLESAAILATCVEIDLHAAVELVDRGCPPATAVRILR